MKKIITEIMLALIMLTGFVSLALTEETNNPPQPKGRMKPPQEAFDACQGKSEGTIVQFTTSRGDILKGVCKKYEGVLAAMPERGAPPSKGKIME